MESLIMKRNWIAIGVAVVELVCGGKTFGQTYFGTNGFNNLSVHVDYGPPPMFGVLDIVLTWTPDSAYLPPGPPGPTTAMTWYKNGSLLQPPNWDFNSGILVFDGSLPAGDYALTYDWPMAGVSGVPFGTLSYDGFGG